MRSILLSIIFLTSVVRAESFFFTLPEEPDLSTAKIDGDQMHLTVTLQRLPIPKAGGIEVVWAEDEQILARVYLAEEPAQGWFPFIKLENQIIQVSTVTRMGPQFASYFEIKFFDWEKAVSTAKALGKLLKLPDDRVVFGEKTAEGDTGQPATRSDSDSEGDDKPQPQSDESNR